MEWICTFLLAAVFTVGLVDMMRAFRFWLLRPLETPPIVVELQLTNEEECEYQLWSVLERLRWLRVPATLQVRCINPTGSAVVEKIVGKFAARHPFVVLGRNENEQVSCGSQEGRG